MTKVTLIQRAWATRALQTVLVDAEVQCAPGPQSGLLHALPGQAPAV